MRSIIICAMKTMSAYYISEDRIRYWLICIPLVFLRARALSLSPSLSIFPFTSAMCATACCFNHSIDWDVSRSEWDLSSTIHGWLSSFNGMCGLRWNRLFIFILQKIAIIASARSRLISSTNRVYHRLWADAISLIEPILCISGIIRRQTSPGLNSIWQVFG